MKSNVITYKVPQDVNTEFFRIVFINNIKHKVKSAHAEDNFLFIELDFTGVKGNEPKQNIETILDDYREYMKDIIGDVIVNLTGEEENEH